MLQKDKSYQKDYKRLVEEIEEDYKQDINEFTKRIDRIWLDTIVYIGLVYIVGLFLINFIMWLVLSIVRWIKVGFKES